MDIKMKKLKTVINSNELNPELSNYAKEVINKHEFDKQFFFPCVTDQIITSEYALYNGDCMQVIPTFPDKSIHLSMYSPPFLGLFNYSSSLYDFSNCENREDGLRQYEFLVKQIARVTKPGRISAVHCTDLMNKDGSQWDYPNEIQKIHERNGFTRKNKITIWKEPLKVRMRTMVKSLMHKLIVEDSTQCFTAMPDYVMIFVRDGENETPVTHDFGLTHYAGELPLLHAHLDAYGLDENIMAILNEDTKTKSMTDGLDNYIQRSFIQLKEKYKNWKDPKTNKLSHIIWQRYASSVWDDIRIDNVIQYQDAKIADGEDGEKHIHPLQLDVYDRLVELYSNEGEIVLEPFCGSGGGVYVPVSMGRFGIGVELKNSYYNQSVKNMKDVKKRFTSKNDNALAF